MSKKQGVKFTIDGNKIQLKNGDVKINGKKIGRAEHAHKYGYHPCIKLTVGKRTEWFEYDDKDVYYMIARKALEFLKEV